IHQLTARKRPFLGRQSHRVKRVYLVRAEADHQFEPHGIAAEPIRYVNLWQPFGFGGQIQTPNAVGIRDFGTDARGDALEATEPRAAATVAGDLLIEKSIRAGADESAEQRQMLCHCAVEVKLISSVVVRRAVLGVEVKASKCC